MGNNLNKRGNGRQSTKYRHIDYLYKIVLVGDSSIGKTSALRRFAGQAFPESHQPTIGVDIEVRLVSLDETLIKFQLWDPTGNESYRDITRPLYRGAHGFIILYDVTRQQTFDNVAYWIEETRKYGPAHAKLMVIGTKSDLFDHKVVSYEDGRSLADGNDSLFFEVSAKDGTNTELALMTFVAKIWEKHNDPM